MTGKELQGEIRVTLASEEDGGALEARLAQINSLTPPPRPEATKETVHIRRFRLFGDRPDKTGGCFHTEDISAILSMINGKPLMLQHSRERLPIGRWFGGKVVNIGGANYGAPDFYVLDDDEEAMQVIRRVDGGIINEASLGFTFRKPTCNICANNIMMCDHVPGNEYKGQVCWYWYDEIREVKEGSLVDRGAEPGTGPELTELRRALSEKANRIEKTITAGRAEMSDEQMLTMGAALGMAPEDCTYDKMLAKVKEMMGSRSNADGDLGARLTAELKTANEKIVELKAAVDRQDGFIEIGKAAVVELRETVKGNAIRIARLTDKNATGIEKTLEAGIDAADHSALKTMLSMQETTLKDAKLAHTCPHCGKGIENIRLTDPGVPDKKDEPRGGRRFRVG